MNRIGLVIFDCDGVLIDSEALCDRVVAASLTDLGWRITPAECHSRFLGLSFYDMVPEIEAQIGRTIGTAWVDEVVVQVSKVFAEEVEPIQGALDALNGVTALGLPWRIGSNSSFAEMHAKFGRVGWTDIVAGRIHSGAAIVARGGRGKPAPDVFLEAAAAESIPPDRCVVIEDSVPGVQAAMAAGMACLGFAPDGPNPRLVDAGARLFHRMADLPTILRRSL